MKASEIRSLFLRYFEKNGHSIVESSSLVPQNDPTLLFTNAGMVQFKDVFLGKEQRAYSRATTSQKCVRAGGKHNDLENVGFTARHHTFFEMLGNFSFGDYFKKEAIHFAWEFVTQELNLPRDRLYVTVYEKDDEAAQIWHEQEGLSLERIYRFGEKDNFWSMGETGPCGPCSEIFMDRGEKYSCGKSTCAMGCDCDRYMEFWNLVFMQFERSIDGKLTPLPRPSVDTGAGLERLAAILQEVDTKDDADVFQEIIAKTALQVGKSYEKDSDLAVSFRVIADHARAITFLVGDGVLPSNEGRGYVLRRIMRRAVRHGKKLGLSRPFLYQAIGFVIDQMKSAYPDLIEKRAFIEKAVLAEEEQFLKTLERGLLLLDEEKTKLGVHKILAGEVAFKLYDTYGFPLDLTRVICVEQGFQIDEAGFEKSMDRQRAESRKHWKGSGQQVLPEIYSKITQELKAKNQLPRFVGYDRNYSDALCVAILILKDGQLESTHCFNPSLYAEFESLKTETVIEAVFAETPFYGEGGGQVGDQGRVWGGDGFEGRVIDVQKPLPELTVVHIQPVRGILRVGTSYTQETDLELRGLTAKNHTATHVLHWALRKLLGEHVKQAGSLVTPDLLRFDFTHFQPLTEQELVELEDRINEKIWLGESVSKEEMPKEKAIALGAIAFFGEKYGEKVRVVRVGEFSTELCGGTHVENSSDMHFFKIVSESGIAAGVRRIIAHTSKGAFQYLRVKDQEIKAVRARLRASSADEILGKIEKMGMVEKQLKKELEDLQAQRAGEEVNALLAQAFTVDGVQVVAAICLPDRQGVKRLRDLSDRVKQKAPSSVVVLGAKDFEGEKAFLLVSVGPQILKRLNANEILQSISPVIGGKGGGKADLAQAGGTQVDGLGDAIEQSKAWIQKKLEPLGEKVYVKTR